jgi:hypothetical protein
MSQEITITLRKNAKTHQIVHFGSQNGTRGIIPLQTNWSSL